MAKAKKLPSGQWRTLVYSHTDPITKKRKYKSFTSESKWESESMAAEYRAKQKERIRASGLDLTVSKAIARYIESKEAIISPATVREYLRSAEKDYNDIKSLKLRELSQEIIQKFINNHCKIKSPKTVHNIHGLLSATLGMFYPELKLITTLPEIPEYERRMPTDEEIKKLLKAAEGTEAEIIILLAASGSLRRGEIAEVRTKDVSESGIFVRCDVVQDKDKKWVTKDTTKSKAGYRFTPLPKELINKLKAIKPIGDDDRLVKLSPTQIYERFSKALRISGIPHIRLHDLRHYYASVLHALKVPDKYIMKYGGWKTSSVLQNVYQHTIEDREKVEQDKILKHFEGIAKGD